MHFVAVLELPVVVDVPLHAFEQVVRRAKERAIRGMGAKLLQSQEMRAPPREQPCVRLAIAAPREESDFRIERRRDVLVAELEVEAWHAGPRADVERVIVLFDPRGFGLGNET